MKFEVEQKHRISDVSGLTARLAERGVEIQPAVEHADRYFNHPCRDFAQTDEAVRIRTVGERSFVTYKGPKVDNTTKTRRELELPLDTSDTGGLKFAELLGALGFRPVLVVHKRRRTFEIEASSRTVEGTIDEIDGLGTFVELELAADEAGVDEAKRVIAALAKELELGPTERLSYLELMLKKLGKLVSN